MRNDMFKYAKRKLIDGVTRIADGIVNEFLIEGEDKAVLQSFCKIRITTLQSFSLLLRWKLKY